MDRKREEGKTAPTNNDDKPDCGIHPFGYPLPFFRTKSVGPDFIGCRGTRKMELFHRANLPPGSRIARLTEARSLSTSNDTQLSADNEPAQALSSEGALISYFDGRDNHYKDFAMSRPSSHHWSPLHRVNRDSQFFRHPDKVGERSRLHLLHEVTAVDLNGFFGRTQFVRHLFVEHP
jgi:hypothetical protein